MLLATGPVSGGLDLGISLIPGWSCHVSCERLLLARLTNQGGVCLHMPRRASTNIFVCCMHGLAVLVVLWMDLWPYQPTSAMGRCVA